MRWGCWKPWGANGECTHANWHAPGLDRLAHWCNEDAHHSGPHCCSCGAEYTKPAKAVK